MKFPFQMSISPRERRLFMILGMVFVGIVTFFVAQYFWQEHVRLTATLEQKASQAEIMREEIQDLEKLQSRNDWLVRQQRPMLAQDVTNEQLLTKVQQAAKGDVIITKHQFLGLQEGGHYRAMGMHIQAQTEWQPFLRFLYELQSPRNQVDFSSLDITVPIGKKSKVLVQAKLYNLYQP